MRHPTPATCAACLLLVSPLALGSAPAGGGGGQAVAVPEIFVTSDQCQACHNGLAAPDGRDVSVGTDWRASVMAHSALDPYWQGAVRREAIDHPGAAAAIENECSRCHMPMANHTARAAGAPGEIFALLPAGAPGAASPLGPLAADGVGCSACHQIEPEGLGTEASFTGGFVVGTQAQRWVGRQVFGPYAIDEGLAAIMRSAAGYEPAESAHIQTSELCATCHTLYTHALGPDGEVLGALPEQVPYLEWRHSSFEGVRPCQDCHMPVLEPEVPIASVLGQPREGFNRHVFRGGNFFLLGLLNRHRDELGVAALPQELSVTADRTAGHLQSEAAEIEVRPGTAADGRLELVVEIRNLAGHKLPTAYPSRRAWVELRVTDGGGAPVFASGRLAASGAIEGNDNDLDPERYEPHHESIESPEQVQIYESVMAGPDGRVTTGLLTGTHYVKDNRLLPDGFAKATAAPDIAVRGAAAADADFGAGGDRIRYLVDVAGARPPFRVRAILWYQPISFRWAQNQAEYASPETDRFARMYASTSGGSALALARDEVEVR